MNKPVRTIALLSASPKGSGLPCVSRMFCNMAAERIAYGEVCVHRFDVRACFAEKTEESTYRAMLESDALLVVFPLYFFCLPGMLMRFLQDFSVFAKAHAAESRLNRVYALVNCGFPEAGINEEAVRVVARFSASVQASFRFGILVGGGGMALGAKDAPFMKSYFGSITDAFDQIRIDTISFSEAPLANVYVEAKFPRKLYFLAGDLGWKHTAKKNGLPKKALRRQPYKRD